MSSVDNNVNNIIVFRVIQTNIKLPNTGSWIGYKIAKRTYIKDIDIGIWRVKNLKINCSIEI